MRSSHSCQWKLYFGLSKQTQGAGVLGGDGMLGQLPGEQEAYGGLYLKGGDGGDSLIKEWDGGTCKWNPSNMGEGGGARCFWKGRKLSYG